MPGASPMDRAVEPTPWYRRPSFIAIVVVVAAAVLLWAFLRSTGSRGRAAEGEIEIAAVQRGEFVNELSTLCDFQPNSSFKLDTADGGRVVAQYAEASDVVEKDQPILLLENPELESELMRRTAEHLENLSALATLQLEFERLDLEINERLIGHQAAVKQRRETHARLSRLASDGLIPESEHEESANEIARLEDMIRTVEASRERTRRVRNRQLESTESSADALAGQLERIQKRIDALEIRAPASGRLALIEVLPGQQLQPGSEVGEVYTEGDFSARCAIDEVYLQDIEIGTRAELSTPSGEYQMHTTNVLPTVTDGRFIAEFGFVDEAPDRISKGQSARLRIGLGSIPDRLMLPIGDYLRESGGTWVFVRSDEADVAVRRQVRMGRRNNSFVEILSGLDQGESVIVSAYDSFSQFETLRIE